MPLLRAAAGSERGSSATFCYGARAGARRQEGINLLLVVGETEQFYKYDDVDTCDDGATRRPSSGSASEPVIITDT